jgi:hypothetical protein
VLSPVVLIDGISHALLKNMLTGATFHGPDAHRRIVLYPACREFLALRLAARSKSGRFRRRVVRQAHVAMNLRSAVTKEPNHSWRNQHPKRELW